MQKRVDFQSSCSSLYQLLAFFEVFMKLKKTWFSQPFSYIYIYIYVCVCVCVCVCEYMYICLYVCVCVMSLLSSATNNSDTDSKSLITQNLILDARGSATRDLTIFKKVPEQGQTLTKISRLRKAASLIDWGRLIISLIDKAKPQHVFYYPYYRFERDNTRNKRVIFVTKCLFSFPSQISLTIFSSRTFEELNIPTQYTNIYIYIYVCVCMCVCV